MRYSLTAFFLVFSLVKLKAQQDLQTQAAAIMAEGKKLYQSEMASWYGTDIFLEKFKQHRNNFSAYLSYLDDKGAHCIFYSKDTKPKVLATITFDATYDVNKAVTDGTEREFTTLENELYTLRNATVALIQTDTLFRHYNNTNFNIVPLLEENNKRVYVLTGTSQSGTVLFGNDYLLTFDAANNVVAKKALHKGLIPIGYGTQDGKEGIGAMHTHLPEMGELMTATDVCTLMLYQHLTKWKQHIVVSKNYVSIWDAQKAHLLAITTEAWKKIAGDKKD